MGLLRVVEMTPAERRVTSALERKAEVDYLGDHLIAKASLQLPEIEIPSRRALEQRTGSKFLSEPGHDASNGYLCTQSEIRSATKRDHDEAQWKSELTVDHRTVPSEIRVRPVEVYGTGEKTSPRQFGEFFISVCSTTPVPNAKHVALTLESPAGTPVVGFEWKAPWPK